MKELSLEKQIYLCKYHDIDTDICNSLEIKRAELEEMLDKLKENGIYEQYRNLSEEEYEIAIKEDKKKSKAEKILSKYNFDKQRKEYKYFKEVLEISSKCKNIEELSLSKIFNIVANKYNVKDYIINNDCQKILKNTYLENKKIFETYEYKLKPTAKDFIIKELNLKYAENKEINDEEEQENIENSDYFADLKRAYIKAPISILLEWSYQKRLYR